MKNEPLSKPLIQTDRIPEEQIREALNRHWHGAAIGDVNAEHDIYHDDAICDYPQSGERIVGRSNLQALRSHHPGKPSGFEVRRMLGRGDLWITEYTINYQGKPAYTVSMMEFRDGKVIHETQYFADPFEAPAWRTQWVQPLVVTADHVKPTENCVLELSLRPVKNYALIDAIEVEPEG